jgi:hypothetical protein
LPPQVQKAWDEIVAAGIVIDTACEDGGMVHGRWHKRWCWGRVAHVAHNITVPKPPSQDSGFALDKI